MRERGSGITPPRVVELLTKEVSEKSMLAVSKATGLGLAAIGRYLKGKGEPTNATLEKLADYFEVSVWELMVEDSFVAQLLARIDAEIKANPQKTREEILSPILDFLRQDYPNRSEPYGMAVDTSPKEVKAKFVRHNVEQGGAYADSNPKAVKGDPQQVKK